ncbi:DUF58 domain-containing protein [Paenibacillus sp. PAMC21692]|uniref:DUF58 domain-containing protein n=1 Tax=Paenibacillus sp. PAMC21692 TaxID=2762320 RepID=UPI00164E40C6|nr:DUF58 domain-containing protein [Paenibacillus sp. PAMC21692]QNK54392.1 DUF58 domain-containing protein [Paenibacillus sp. PAMC21692]
MNEKKKQRFRKSFIAAVYVSSLFYFLFQGGKTSLMLFIILNLLLLYLLLGRYSGIAKVKGSRMHVLQGSGSQPDTLTAGSSLDVNVEVRIPGYYPLPYVIVRDGFVRHDGRVFQFETSFVPNWKRTGSISYRTPPLPRGEYRFAETECLAYDVFGLFEHSGSFATESAFSVLPQTVPLRQWSGFQRGIRGPYSHAAASRSAKETTQINGVREYHYGDRLSRVHWNATAKTGEWKSKAFERESLPRTLLILDRHADSYGDSQDRFELAVSVTASFIEHGLKDDTAMGLLSAGLKVTMLPPRSGVEQRSLAMKHLTSVSPDAPYRIYDSLTRSEYMIEPGCFVLLVTADIGSGMIRSMEWLSRKGVTPCLIHIGDPDDKLSGNIAWKGLIRSRGWQLYEVKHLQDLPSALEGSVTA